MEYLTIIAFGVLGLALAAASRLSLARGRRRIEAAQAALQSTSTENSKRQTTGVLRSDLEKAVVAGLKLSKLPNKARLHRHTALGIKRSTKSSKAK